MKSPAYDPIRKRFFNPHIEDEKRTLKDALLWKMGYFDDASDELFVPHDFTPPLPDTSYDSALPSALWINHSTYLINVHNLTILTDPIWGRRCSPFPFVGPVRQHEPPLTLNNLGHVDHVLISHNHYDHLDKNTVLRLHALHPSIHWWVPLGVKAWFTRLGIMQVTELDWWESYRFSSTLTFTAVPTQHFSGRGPHDAWKTLWAGWVVESSFNEDQKRLYFVGDTGYNPFDFKAIGQKWPFMDLSLIPIGSYIPRKFMSPVHIDPWQAVEIHKEVSSKQSLGMHWNTFRLSDEEKRRPPYDLFLALQASKLDPLSFLAVPVGHAINW